MKARTLFILALSLIATSTQLLPEISVIVRLRSILETINTIEKDKTVVVTLDIDNTVLYAKDVDAQDGLFRGLIDLYQREGLSAEEALDRAVEHYHAAQATTSVDMVDPETSLLLKEIVARDNVHVIGLTARSGPMISITRKQFRSLGLSFGPHRGAWGRAYHFVNPAIKDETAYYSPTGILFCGKHKKGDVLKDFLANKVHFIPDVLIFVDDHMKYVVCVEDCCKSLGIKEFYGFHFNQPIPTKALKAPTQSSAT